MTTLTHAIFERRHNLHALPGYPQLVGINIVGGATLLALVTICLHGRAAILSVKGHTYHRGEVRLSQAKTGQDILTHFSLPISIVRTKIRSNRYQKINPIPNNE